MADNGPRSISDVSSALGVIRRILLLLEPSGPNGFEGLIATALAELSGLTIRLAKSGSQYGRDASSPPDEFAIAMEGKRYDSPLRLEDLAGKAVLGGQSLQGDLDLWVLGTTAEVGDETSRRLTAILDNFGISFLLLDWAERPLPPLAVLLASTPVKTLRWFQQHKPDLDPNTIQSSLELISRDSAFFLQQERLRTYLSVAELGMDSLRSISSEWLRKRFRSRQESQLSFGQFVNVADPVSPAIVRTGEAEALGKGIAAFRSLDLIAVIGSEGTGKTWLIAQWWLDQPDEPILLLVAGRRTELLEPSNPTLSIARLLAEQEGDHGTRNTDKWVRRLERWSRRTSTALRFVLVIDGLNEAYGQPWADILKSFAAKMKELGGILVISSREVYWERDVLPRLPRRLKIYNCPISGYSDNELTAILKRVRLMPSDLSHPVRDFIRNPRVCTVAIDLLERLALHPEELTVERLLLEYWHWRLEERGDLVSHNIHDLEKLLRSHARSLLNDSQAVFSRDEWRQHSGAASRMDGRNLQDDLTDIEEGRFLHTTAGDPHNYKFRPETLPFAVALLITHELKSRITEKLFEPEEILSQILESVRGFDIVAEIVGAAVGLSCLDSSFPQDGRIALIAAWLGLQNVTREAVAQIRAYIPACPKAFLDAAELSDKASRRANRFPLLLDLLLDVRHHPAMRTALGERIQKWLGRWTRQSQPLGSEEEQKARHARREARISMSLEALSTEERSLFDRVTVEIPDRDGLRLDRASAVLMSSREQSQYVAGLLGWAMANAMAYDLHSAYEELAWAIRLNRQDYADTERGIQELVYPLRANASEPIRRAVSMVLDLLGSKDAALVAEQLVPTPPTDTWRRVELFSLNDPFDPESVAPPNLENSLSAISELEPSEVWKTVGNTMEDANLESATAPLARFAPAPIIECLRTIAKTSVERSELSLRQLSWHLPRLSPLFDDATISAVQAGYRRLLETPRELGPMDFDVVAGEFVQSLNPHLDAESQLEVLLDLPEATPEYLNLGRGIKALSPESLESHLTSATSSKDAKRLRRILFFSSCSKPVLTDGTRRIVAQLVANDDEGIASCAAELSRVASDEGLDRLILGNIDEIAPKIQEDNMWLSRSLACAIVRQNRTDLLPHVKPRYIGYAMSALDRPAVELYVELIDRSLQRLLKPVEVTPPPRADVVLTVSEDGLEIWKSAEEGEDPDEDPTSRFGSIGTVESLQQFNEKQKKLFERLEDYEDALVKEQASSLGLSWTHGLYEVSKSHHETVSKWLDQILTSYQGSALRQVHNLGLSLATAHSFIDSCKASAVFRHLRNWQPFMRVLIGKQQISLYHHALFGSAHSPELNKLREEVFTLALNDLEVEIGVLASENSNSGRAWLDEFVQRLVESRHPADQALGITIAGLRQPNPVSVDVLGQGWGPRFLGRVSGAARDAYLRAGWAKHWLELLSQANDRVDFWRFGVLAEGVADWRFVEHIDLSSSPFMVRFGEELYERLEKGASKRSSKRKETLFGITAPDREMVIALNDEGPAR